MRRVQREDRRAILRRSMGKDRSVLGRAIRWELDQAGILYSNERRLLGFILGFPPEDVDLDKLKDPPRQMNRTMDESWIMAVEARFNEQSVMARRCGKRRKSRKIIMWRDRTLALAASHRKTMTAAAVNSIILPQLEKRDIHIESMFPELQRMFQQQCGQTRGLIAEDAIRTSYRKCMPWNITGQCTFGEHCRRDHRCFYCDEKGHVMSQCPRNDWPQSAKEMAADNLSYNKSKKSKSKASTPPRRRQRDRDYYHDGGRRYGNYRNFPPRFRNSNPGAVRYGNNRASNWGPTRGNR